MAIEKLMRIDKVDDSADIAVNVNGRDYRASAPSLKAYVQEGLEQEIQILVDEATEAAEAAEESAAEAAAAAGVVGPQVREALRRSYAEAGHPILGDFSDAGLVVTTVTDVVLWEPTGVAYSYSGTLPHTIGAGETPIGNPLWVSRASATLNNNIQGTYAKQFKTVADLKAGLLAGGQSADFSAMIGEKVEWRGYFTEQDGGGNTGIIKSGAHTDDMGHILSLGANTYVEADHKGSFINVATFGVMQGQADAVGNASRIQRACDYLATNFFGQSRSLYFPGGRYVINTDILLTVNHGDMVWWSDSSATLDIRNLASNYPITVDYFTDATNNFLKFDMKNIYLMDTSLAGGTVARRGLCLKRVIGSKFEGCHFEWLAVPLNCNDDTNLNIFENCEWRGCKLPITASTGVANNNIFSSCQWRYSSGQIFNAKGSPAYPGTWSGTTFIGGDAEPYNVYPMFELQNTTMINLRLERNEQQPVALVYDDNNINASIHSDGATQSLGFTVIGSRNKIDIDLFGGAKALTFEATAKDNEYSIKRIATLPANCYTLVQDMGVGNIGVVNGMPQIHGLKSGIAQAITPDFASATWVKQDCTVVLQADGSYLVTATGNNPMLYAHFIGTGGYPGVVAGLTRRNSNNAGQGAISISNTLAIPVGAAYFSGTGGFVRQYVSKNNLEANNDFYVMIDLTVNIPGGATYIRDFAINFNGTLPKQ